MWTIGEDFTLPGGIKAMKKKYQGWGEIGLTYTRRENGEYIIIGIWTRQRASSNVTATFFDLPL